MELYLGHTIEYWLELEKRAKEIGGTNMTDLIQEIATLKGKLSFTEDRIRQISEVLSK